MYIYNKKILVSQFENLLFAVDCRILTYRLKEKYKEFGKTKEAMFKSAFYVALGAILATSSCMKFQKSVENIVYDFSFQFILA